MYRRHAEIEILHKEAPRPAIGARVLAKIPSREMAGRMEDSKVNRNAYESGAGSKEQGCAPYARPHSPAHQDYMSRICHTGSGGGMIVWEREAQSPSRRRANPSVDSAGPSLLRALSCFPETCCE